MPLSKFLSRLVAAISLNLIAIAFFIIWDGLYNQGIYLDHFIRFLVNLMHSVGL